MSSYQVLARKCRPQRFSEIVGQEHITRTLQNAIKRDRVGHAYLFVGSRGIGKTTSARIFAKALNCESGDKVIEPCCECQSCLEIAAGTSLDVQEIDGASHNKVEHVRELREGVQYSPNRGRYRIYIIDEVHMLTPAAWNALLKTLEEPPPHVKFFFATTEPHKVLPTIVSRCQRFDLKRLSVKLIAGRLREIAATEKVAINEGALVAIARAADGGMRDAQSIFDQIISFCGAEGSPSITESDVTDVFGLASGRELANVAASVLGNQPEEALGIVAGLADRGRDLERFYSDFVLFFRNVMISQVCADPAGILDVSHAELEDITAIAKQTPPPLIRRGLEALIAEEYRLKMALNKRVYLEVALVKVMDDLHSVRLDDVIKRLNQIRGTEELPETAGTGATAPRVTLPPRQDKTEQESDSADAGPNPAEAGKLERPTSNIQRPTSNLQESDPRTDVRPNKMKLAPSVGRTSKSGLAGEGTPAYSKFQESASAEEPPPAVGDSTQLTPGEDGSSPHGTPSPADSVAEKPAEDQPVTESPGKPEAKILTPEKGKVKEKEAPAEPQDDTPAGTLSEESGQNAVEHGDTVAESEPDDYLEEEEMDEDFSEDVVESFDGGEKAAGELLARLVSLFRKDPTQSFRVMVLKKLRPVSFRNGVLEAAYPQDLPEAELAELKNPDMEKFLNGNLMKFTGNSKSRLLIKCWKDGVSDEERGQRLVSTPEVMERVKNNPFVKEVVDLFQGELIDVRGKMTGGPENV